MSFIYRIYCLIYPERCPYCGDIIKSETIACKACMKKLDTLQKPIVRGAFGFRCVSSFLYGGTVRRMILRVKYHERIQYLPQIAVVMEKDVRQAYGNIDFDCISYVPMHPVDQKKRGYNQAELLGRQLSDLLGIPCVDLLEKTKRTEKQQRLQYAKRKKNLIGAFRVTDTDAVKGKRILMIDDIITTGITLGTCCQTLNRAKPQMICCATIANANHRIDDAAII